MSQALENHPIVLKIMRLNVGFFVVALKNWSIWDSQFHFSGFTYFGSTKLAAKLS